MSVLSTVLTPRASDVTEPGEQGSKVRECVRLIFTLVSEAMSEHKENSKYFRVSLSVRSLVYPSL